MRVNAPDKANLSFWSWAQLIISIVFNILWSNCGASQLQGNYYLQWTPGQIFLGACLRCVYVNIYGDRTSRLSLTPQRRHISRPAAPAFINQNCIDITWHKVKQCPLAEWIGRRSREIRLHLRNANPPGVWVPEMPWLKTQFPRGQRGVITYYR